MHRTERLPNDTKNGKVVKIPKTNYFDLSDTNYYRPISLLPLISRPLAKYIHKNLLQHLENNNLIHQYQSGFRPKYPCHTALARLCDGWLSAVNHSETVGTVSLDFKKKKKAFELIDHSPLLKKLSLYLKDSSSVLLFVCILQSGHNVFFKTANPLPKD